jgi:hypothetical protein
LALSAAFPPEQSASSAVLFWLPYPAPSKGKVMFCF